ncbi:MAG TPA: TRAP transporter small permease [Beijerinckiaceae bacterium]|nr:TRAP transporter small permease [Beijerinckiaceae bacterium]
MANEIHSKVDADELAHTFDEQQAVDLGHIAVEDWLTLSIFWLMALCVFLQFFTRYVLNDSFAWTEEIATYCLVVIVFLGSSMCVRLSRHIQVDFLYRYMSERVGFAVSTVIDILRVGFFAYAIKIVYRYIDLVAEEQMTTIQYPKGIFYWIVFGGFVLMLLRSVQVAWQNWSRRYSVLTRPGAFDGSEAL